MDQYLVKKRATNFIYNINTCRTIKVTIKVEQKSIFILLFKYLKNYHTYDIPLHLMSLYVRDEN